jgi:hypothetical protein
MFQTTNLSSQNNLKARGRRISVEQVEQIGDKAESGADRTLGFEEPAKPALMVAVPLSITIGWLNKSEPSAFGLASAAALMMQ